jgi:hypothetical protein
MTTPTLALHRRGSCKAQCLCGAQVNGLSEIPDEAPVDPTKASRGAITGILLGAGMWAAIFFFAVAAFNR